MKKILLTLLLVLHLAADDKTTPLLIGAGPYFQSQPYKDADMKIVPSPVVFFDNHIFYVRWTRVGLYLAGDAQKDYSWGVSLTAQPRPFGYRSGDSPYLKGMNRDSSFEAGLAFDAEYKNTFFNMLFFQDILNKSDSYIARLELGEHINIDKFDLYPSIMAIYHADRFNNYYYGVKPDEATSFRAAYDAKAGIDFSFQTYLKYTFSKHYSALLNFRADYLCGEEQNSPIVGDKYMFSGLISLLYRLDL